MTPMQTSPLNPVQSPLLSQAPGLTHGFFDRAGGVSTGLYASLNCGPGSGDDSHNVSENRARVATWFDSAPSQLISLYQIHSAKVISLRQPWSPEAAPQADAMVTATPGIALGLLTADCGPLLLCDPKARVIAAAHAGWQGAFAGIIEAVVAVMQSHGASRDNISAVLGPTISQSAYQVGAEFRQRFVDTDERFSQYFGSSNKKQHYQFDLPGFIMKRLQNAGIENCVNLDLCTYADHSLFSYRRTTHLGEPDYGRNLSAIMLKD